MVKYLCLLVLSLFWSTVALRTLRGQVTRTLSTGVGNALVAYDEFGDSKSPGCVIILHGSGGPLPLLYREQAVLFGVRGFYVLMPHYFDATRTTTPSPENYQTWARVTEDFVAECRRGAATRKVFLVGYSLGASVALAAGSQSAPVDGIAEWYGSLPDEFFYQMKGMPPLLILHGEQDSNIPIMNAQQLVRLCGMKQLRCDHHFYADQGHGFTGKALEDADQRTQVFFTQFLPGKQVTPTAQP